MTLLTNRRILVLVAAVALVAIAWRVAGPGPERSTAATASSASPAQARDAANPPPAMPAAPASTPAADAPASALPAETLPLSQRLAELQRWADAGHPEASCRLVVERMRCRMLRISRPQAAAGGFERRLEEQGRLEEANAEAEKALRRLEQDAACREADAGGEGGALALLAPAAAAGHAPSQLLYFTIGRQFRFQRGIYAHPGFDAWRRDAARYLRAAAEAGLPEANEALARAARTDSDFADGLVPDDPAEAYLRQRLAARLFGRDNFRPGQRGYGLDEATQARLEAEAERLHRERFGGRQFRYRPLDASGPNGEPALTASDFCGPPLPL